MNNIVYSSFCAELEKIAEEQQKTLGNRIVNSLPLFLGMGLGATIATNIIRKLPKNAPNGKAVAGMLLPIAAGIATQMLVPDLAEKAKKVMRG